MNHTESLEPKLDINQLLTASAFPHLTQTIELIETHISWVILTGELAYKIKKPVKLDFLDFSTTEKRHDYCLREMEINSFFAPDLYLDVVPITRFQSQCRIAGSGATIDWAIKMKQFPQSALLINQLRNATGSADAKSELTTECMDRLAQQIARYHHRAAVAKPDSQHADLKNVVEPAEANCVYLFDNLCRGTSRDDVRRLHDWTRLKIQADHDTFDSRRTTGFIRACHGDLHLGNVLLLDNRFYAFDAIEFNDALRWIDTINDLAFLLMELYDHERHDMANRLLNQYLESSGDYRGLAVLRFYLVYRAMVRAKIDLIRAQQANRAELSPEGIQYLQHALGFVDAPQQRLWITHGFSGSGKSTQALRVVERQGFVRLRSDVVRKHLFDLQPLETPTSKQVAQMYSTESSRATYQELLNQAKIVLDGGFSAIVDATFLIKKQRSEFAQLADELGIDFGIVRCTASDSEELTQRLVRRGPDPSDANESVLKWQLANHDPLDPSELAQVISV